MFKFINIYDLVRYLFDEERLIGKEVLILQALLEARCVRIFRMAEQMPGKVEANYKAIQRFLTQVDLKTSLLRLFQEQAEYVIGDPTEMERPHAKKTAYVGQLSDGQTLGYWLLVVRTKFARPYRFEGGQSPSISSPTHPKRLKNRPPPASRSIFEPLHRSNPCWENGPWCWIGN